MVAFVLRMPSGIPGALSRQGSALVTEPNILLSTNPPVSFGVPTVVDPTTGHIRGVLVGDVAASVYGFLVRAYPTESGTNAFGTTTPNTALVSDVMRLGYMTVKVTNGTPVKNGAVYTRTVLNGAIPAAVIGDVEAVADGTNTFVIPGAQFTGGMDANGNCEISYAL
jgi:hypothetical protein